MENKRKVLVAISHSPLSLKLLRSARSKLSSSDKGFCVYVETPKNKNLDARESKQLKTNIDLAEKYGFEVFVIQAQYVHEGLIGFIKEYGIEYLTIGSTRKRFISGSNYNKILSELPKTEINVIKLEEKFKRLKLNYSLSLSKLSISIAIVAVVTILNYLAFFSFEIMSHSTFKVSMFYILAIIVVTLLYGFFNSVVASLLSASLINYYFTRPAYEFQVDDAGDFVNLIFFIIVSLTIGALTSFSRHMNRSALKANVLNQSLMKLGNRMVGLSKISSIIKALEEEMSEMIDSDVKIILFKKHKINFDKSHYAEDDIVSINICYNELNKVETENYVFMPIYTRNMDIGVISVSKDNMPNFSVNTERLVISLANLSANAIERAILTKELDETELLKEKEKLRADILSSVSHDLKTPLASIIGSLTAMEHMKDNLDVESVETLRSTAVDEAERLNQFINNILEMTKIESGGVKLNRKLYDFDELAEDVVKRVKVKNSTHEIEHIKNNENIKINVDKVLIQQVLYNLIDNAMKYSNEGTKVTITSERQEEKFFIEIMDEGFGIPDDKKPKIFDKFERIKLKDKTVAGTGLGLAICKSMMDLMGGKIVIEDNPQSSTGTGTVFKLIF